MAEAQRKEQAGDGIVVVLDVGEKVGVGAEKSFFANAKDCVLNLLQRKIFVENVPDLVGIVLFGTTRTDNHLASGDNFQHITVLRDLETVDWEIIEEIRALRCDEGSGDWLDAVVVAMDILHTHDSDKRLNDLKIVLLTDFSSDFTVSRFEEVTTSLVASKVQLLVITPNEYTEYVDTSEDVDAKTKDHHQPSSSNGASSQPAKDKMLSWDGKPKTVVQQAGESLAEEMVAKTEGLLCGLEDANSQLMRYEKNKKTSVAWNASLEIGDLSIKVTGRIMVQEAPPPTWIMKYNKDPSKEVRTEVSYHLDDEAQTEVPADEVIDGHYYGTTLVPCPDDVFDGAYCSNSQRSLSVVGFTDASKVPHKLRVGNQVVAIMPQDDNEVEARALSALIRSLAEMDKVAITRRIYSMNSDPVMGALFPEINEDYECLLWIELPFGDDLVDYYDLPSIQKTIDKVTEEEIDVMDNFIKSMILTDDEFDPRETPDPNAQYYYAIMTHFALHPDDKVVPEPPAHIKDILKVPERLIELRGKAAKELRRVFPTQEVAPVTKRPSGNVFDVLKSEDESAKKPKVEEPFTSQGDIRERVTTITTDNPVQDFTKLLKEEAPDFDDICQRMGKAVLLLVDGLMEAYSDNIYATKMEKVLECLNAFRRESCAINPGPYNTFMDTLKDIVTSNSQTELWGKIEQGGLGLITEEESGSSSVGKEAAAAFLQLAQSTPAAPVIEATDADMEDLLDQL